MIKGNGALPEIWVLHEITEDSTGTRDGSYNDFPPSFLPLSHYHGQWPWLSRDGAPKGEAPSDGSGDGRWGYQPYYYRSGGAPKGQGEVRQGKRTGGKGKDLILVNLLTRTCIPLVVHKHLLLLYYSTRTYPFLLPFFT